MADQHLAAMFDPCMIGMFTRAIKDMECDYDLGSDAVHAHDPLQCNGLRQASRMAGQYLARTVYTPAKHQGLAQNRERSIAELVFRRRTFVRLMLRLRNNLTETATP